MDDLETWRREHAADIVGESPPMVRALEIIRRVARCGASVLLVGETGTGKELFARALHRGSRRASGAFVAVSCAVAAEHLVEDRIAAAAGGTLFLDEVGELSLAAQAKLLRVLEERTVDVRVVAATHRDLGAMVAAGTFRADLYFRISVVPVELPALRDRGRDIELLAEAAVRRAVERDGRAVELDRSARAALRAQVWPGNVRELNHTVERAVALAEGTTLRDIDLDLARPLQLDLRTALAETERRLIRTALERSSGNRTTAAALLGLNRTTLVEKLRKYA